MDDKIIKNFMPDICIRWCIITLVLIILIILSSFVMFRFYLDKTLGDEIEAYLGEFSESNVKTIQNKIDADIKMGEGIAAIMGIQEEFYPEEIYKYISNNNDSFENYTLIGFIFNGESWYSEGNEKIYEYLKNDFLRALTGKNVITSSESKNLETKVIYYIIPIYKNSKVIGAISYSISADEYSKNLNLKSFNNNCYSYIIDSYGEIISYSMHKDSSRDFKNVFDVIEADEIILQNMKINLQKGEEGVLDYLAIGESKKMIYKPLNINDWYVATIIPDRITYQKTNSIQTINMVFIATTMLIFIFLGILVFIEQKKYRDALCKLAYTDEKTGYPNMNSFRITAKKILNSNYSTNYALVTLDIERFKIVNDIFGYKQGDEVIKHIGDTISEMLSDKEYFCRVIGDRFNILMEFKEKNSFEERLNVLIDKIIRYKLDSNANYKLIACAGVYIIEKRDISIDRLCDWSSLALAKVKGFHISGYYFYNEDIRNKAIIENELENDMIRAIENNEFKVYMQPKYNISDSKIVGAEALIRWEHPQKGMLLPSTFIPLFEKNAFVVKLDMFIFEEVCRLIKKMDRKGLNKMSISVNQSKMHIYNSKYIETLMKSIEKYSVPAKMIEIELTESVFFSNTKLLIKTTEDLHRVGFKLSIDDFGSGYSSLNLLKDIMVDVVKLEREFLNETTNNTRGKKIIENIIIMARDLGIITVAEGVETERQVEFLKRAGCDIAQGYYYAKPMTLEEFEKMIDL